MNTLTREGDPLGGEDSPPDPGSGGFLKRHRRPVLAVLGSVALVGFFYFVVPQIAGLGSTLQRLRAANKWWLALGIVVEALSLGSEIALLHGIFARPKGRIGWRVSYQIELAGGAATKVFATAGAGGVALTVWALRASGLHQQEAADGMVCFEILEYGVYMAALVLAGFGLWLGVFSGPAPVGLTLIPAVFGLVVILIVLSLRVVDSPLERFVSRRAEHAQGRAERWWSRAAAVPRTLRGGLDTAFVMVRRRDLSLLGAAGVWAFDIAALWASFRAFGHPPPGGVLVMGYYVGTLGNALPLPGGIGGVEGGMIGSFIAFGVNGSLAVLAVLAYRTISYWLPTLPGAIAYARLRHIVNGWQGQSTS